MTSFSEIQRQQEAESHLQRLRAEEAMMMSQIAHAEDDDDDDELRAAIEASLREAQVELPAAVVAGEEAQNAVVNADADAATTTAAAADSDADYALALKLQEELNNEHELEMIQRRQEQSNQKVRVAFRSTAAATTFLSAHTNENDNFELDEDEEDEKEQSYFYGDDGEADFVIGGGDGGIVTKHDPRIASKKHIKALSNSPLLSFGGNLNDPKAKTDELGVSNRVFNEILSFSRKANGRGKQRKSKSEFMAAAEGVLDQQTRMTLYRLLNSGRLVDLGGALSQGKESVVYTASFNDKVDDDVDGGDGGGDDGAELMPCAVKVYRTTSLAYKNRTDFMVGERRFEKTSLKQTNEKKFVRVWAEKEMRNLRRMRQRSPRLPCPQPLLLKENVLVLELIGSSDGRAAPRLVDAVKAMSKSAIVSAYEQVLWIMWRLQHEAHLVHGDLSSHNLLYQPNEERVYVIDVSQAVEADNVETSYEHLRRDVKNVTNFFRSTQAMVPMYAHRLFEFITDDLYKKEEDAMAYVEQKAWESEANQPAEVALEQEFLHANLLRSVGALTNEQLFQMDDEKGARCKEVEV